MADEQMFRDVMTMALKKFTDEGKLIEAGWVSLRMVWLKPETPEHQVEDLRMAFMAGAQHLFSSMMTIMDPGEEPTEADEHRMELINNEMTTFYQELVRKLGLPRKPRQ